MSRPIIIDTDPGIDDAIAILLALRCPELALVGVTTVAGNLNIDRVTRNAARVLALGGISPGGLPLHQGMRAPLTRTALAGEEPIHGPDGLGGAEVPDVAWPIPPRHAVDWMEEQVRSRPGELTIVAIGPCTNVAALLQRLPDPAMIAEVVIMGGAFLAPGNTNWVAEYNFHTDPEAARLVLQSGVKCRIVGLNVTRRALLYGEDAQRIAHAGPVGRAIAQMSRYYIERYQKTHGVAACAMHDPLAVAVTARPDLVRWEPYYVDIECMGELTRGMSVADILRKSGKAPNALVAMDVDAPAFRDFLVSRLLGGEVA
jgi:inosine-uridine nucleoside N-ribohydrolase